MAAVQLLTEKAAFWGLRRIKLLRSDGPPLKSAGRGPINRLSSKNQWPSPPTGAGFVFRDFFLILQWLVAIRFVHNIR